MLVARVSRSRLSMPAILSAPGQKQTFAPQQAMSALGHKRHNDSDGRERGRQLRWPLNVTAIMPFVSIVPLLRVVLPFLLEVFCVPAVRNA